MATKVPWGRLLSTHRVGDPTSPKTQTDRLASERDYDRIVFSSPFRRLQDKTQVFPLSSNDYTRTRLTHSLEAASVGRSLGRLAQRTIRRFSKTPALPEIPTMVSAACLAHDIGNPPFGHSGEDAIRSWALLNQDELETLTPQQKADLVEFEGNAQALRVVAALQVRRRVGGLRLTRATIAAMMKYPCGSRIDGTVKRDESKVSQKKFGFFEAEQDLAVRTLRALGLKRLSSNAFARHPLAFLVEAADDICYRIVDLEDSVDQGLVPPREAIEVLGPLAKGRSGFKNLTYALDERVRWMRAQAINGLIDVCHAVFEEQLDSILDGTFDSSLVQASKLADEYNHLEQVVRTSAYENERVLKVEVAGFRTIGGLLDAFVPALLSRRPDKQDLKLIALMPISYLQRPGSGMVKDRRAALRRLSRYQRILAATDFVSGMTDSYAVELYRNLTGVKLPD